MDSCCCVRCSGQAPEPAYSCPYVGRYYNCRYHVRPCCHESSILQGSCISCPSPQPGDSGAVSYANLVNTGGHHASPTRNSIINDSLTPERRQPLYACPSVVYRGDGSMTTAISRATNTETPELAHGGDLSRQPHELGHPSQQANTAPDIVQQPGTARGSNLHQGPIADQSLRQPSGGRHNSSQAMSRSGNGNSVNARVNEDGRSRLSDQRKHTRPTERRPQYFIRERQDRGCFCCFF